MLTAPVSGCGGTCQDNDMVCASEPLRIETGDAGGAATDGATDAAASAPFPACDGGCTPDGCQWPRDAGQCPEGCVFREVAGRNPSPALLCVAFPVDAN